MKKIITVFLCMCMLFLAVACNQKPQNTPYGDTHSTDTSETQDNPDGSKDYESQKKLYDDIVAQFTALLTAKQNEQALPPLDTSAMDEQEAVIAKTLHAIVDDLKTAEGTKNLGYGYKDLDGNGTPELILMSKYLTIDAIFTISNQKVILLKAFCGGDFLYLTPKNNHFLIQSVTNSENIQERTRYICHVDDDKMVYDAIFGAVYNTEENKISEQYRIIDGARVAIGDEEYKELSYEHNKASLAGYQVYIKSKTPYIHLPLGEMVRTEGLPVADFSSYAAIRETYKAISTCIEDFSSSSWAMGEYDNLFAFPDDTDFEYYTLLLNAAYHANYNVGYDEIDLNGDGVDELVLMNEDYSIKAIFTQKNGRPILLGAFGYEVCWLDGQDKIHIDNESYYDLEYSLYHFTKDGNYVLEYNIFMTQYGNRYLTKNGKTVKMTFEESMEIYHDDYCCYSEPFKTYEHTRNTTDLSYTPLIPNVENLSQTAVLQTWLKYADAEKTSGKDMARTNTYITFENATERQMDVKFRYKFIYSYPDPNRENHLLDDITASELTLTATFEDGKCSFDKDDVKGYFEFGQEYLWLIIEESTDERFAVGAHCYTIEENVGIIE